MEIQPKPLTGHIARIVIALILTVTPPVVLWLTGTTPTPDYWKALLDGYVQEGPLAWGLGTCAVLALVWLVIEAVVLAAVAAHRQGMRERRGRHSRRLAAD